MTKRRISYGILAILQHIRKGGISQFIAASYLGVFAFSIDEMLLIVMLTPYFYNSKSSPFHV